MTKESVLIGIIGLLGGLLIAGSGAVLAVNNNNHGMMQMMGMRTSLTKNADAGHMGMSMNDMSDDLKNRSGDDFDENFVAMMIAHHQGAIDMARLAETRATHDEVKQLSKDIITAQTKEIESMQQWQQLWGYNEDTTNSMHNMH